MVLCLKQCQAALKLLAMKRSTVSKETYVLVVEKLGMQQSTHYTLLGIPVAAVHGRGETFVFAMDSDGANSFFNI